MEETHNNVSSLNIANDIANEIIRNQDTLIDILKRENAALREKTELCDNIIAIQKLLDARFPDVVL